MPIKLCKRCNEEKEVSSFNKNKLKKDGLQTCCRSCSNLETKKHYKDNKNYYFVRNKTSKLNVRKKYLEFLKKSHCIICGENHPAALDFDHIDPSQKKMTISCMVGNYPWESVLKEIEKCQILCANCHRKKTANQFNWYTA